MEETVELCSAEQKVEKQNGNYIKIYIDIENK